MTRTPQEEEFVTKATMAIFAFLGALVALPVLAIAGGLAWRLCKAVAGA